MYYCNRLESLLSVLLPFHCNTDCYRSFYNKLNFPLGSSCFFLNNLFNSDTQRFLGVKTSPENISTFSCTEVWLEANRQPVFFLFFFTAKPQSVRKNLVCTNNPQNYLIPFIPHRGKQTKWSQHASQIPPDSTTIWCCEVYQQIEEVRGGIYGWNRLYERSLMCH